MSLDDPECATSIVQPTGLFRRVTALDLGSRGEVVVVGDIIASVGRVRGASLLRRALIAEAAVD